MKKYQTVVKSQANSAKSKNGKKDDRKMFNK